MNFFEKTLMKISLILRKLSVKLKDFANGLYTQRVIDKQLPKSEVKWGNFEASRWFKNGDHPEDKVYRVFEDTGELPIEPREGEVVRYYRHPGVPGTDSCKYCNTMFHSHGWIDTLEGGYIVCPGDWIIKGISGKFYPCKRDIFEATYELVGDA